MWCSFRRPYDSIGLFQYCSTHCHSQLGMGISMWDTGELSHHDHIGVLLQHARFRYLYTTVCYADSRYTYRSHSKSCFRDTTHSMGSASWLPSLSTSEDIVQGWTSVSFLWDIFFMGERQSTLCSGFAKVLRFLNMVMSFVLHPLSHYNSITELCTRFLLSLIEDLSIDFPSHLILSFIDVYRDTTTRDKLIFPSAITQILHHLSIPYLQSSDFTVISAISICSIKRGLASTEAATNRDGDSSSPFYSIHLCSFFFEWWCDA